jgi:hypothetical protein
LLAAIAAASAPAQSLPPISPDMLGKAAVACVKTAPDGTVADAFLIESTGDRTLDGEMIAWVRKLRWDPSESADSRAENWFPMVLAFGNTQPPRAPPTCAPANSAPPATKPIS